jgi:tetratricopeptide (TPR) repeat protein
MLVDNPTDAFLRFALAKEHEKMQADEKAREIYQQLVDDQPDYVGTYYHLGKTLERLNQPAQAFSTYSTGMEICKRLGERHAMSELAGARLELGDEDDFE